MNGFFEALYPPYHTLGTISSLRGSAIPEARRGIQVVKYWAQDVLSRPPPTKPRAQYYLTDVSRAANVSLTFDEGERGTYVFNSAAASACATMPGFIRQLPHKHITNIFHDYLCAQQIDTRVSIIKGYHFIK